MNDIVIDTNVLVHTNNKNNRNYSVGLRGIANIGGMKGLLAPK
jgi:hypothetical protein